MDLKQLDYFLTVCKEKSLTKAASRLYISQQGLSKSISNLENELGVPLFIRTNSGVELTQFGEALEKYASHLINQHDFIINSIKSKKEIVSNTISIGFATGIFELLPPKFLSNFIKDHPKAKFNIASFVDDKCSQSILDYKINIGFCTGPIDTEYFDSHYTERRKYKIVLSKSHPLANKEKIYLKDLQNEKIITLNTKNEPQEALLQQSAKKGVHPSIYLNIAEVKLMGELCSSNHAISFFAGKESKLPNDIKAVQVEDLDVDWEFHIISNKRSYQTDLAKEFIDYTKKELRDYR